MVFRRPRVNVKPNVQATRPVSTIVRPSETSVESISTPSQEEQSTQQIDPPIAPAVIEELIPKVEDTNEISQQPSSPVSLPIVPPSTSTSIPTPSSPLPPSSPPPPSSPQTSSLPPLTPVPTARPFFRRKVIPHITGKAVIHHRRIKIKTTQTDTTNDPVRKQSISSTDGQNTMSGPQLKIDANGALVIDEESLYIRNIDDTPRNTIIVEGQFNDDNLTHQSYRKIGRRKRWNNRDTLRFYQALRMCGTDFTLIARVFPNRDRDDIKRKFKTEDRANRSLVDSALKQRIPFDLTCFYSPSEESSVNENGSDMDDGTPKPTRKRRMVKRKQKQPTSSDPLEINRRREKRLQAKKNIIRIKKSAEFINDDDEDDSSMDVADTVEVITTTIESKLEQIIQFRLHKKP
ncbi:unnamed protein product [Rotaria sp. Silwood1]|nr:unnamed protein product [Rotaria sp. Silwood1]